MVIPVSPRDVRFSSLWAKTKSEEESQREGASPRIRPVAKPEMVKWVRKFFTWSGVLHRLYIV